MLPAAATPPAAVTSEWVWPLKDRRLSRKPTRQVPPALLPRSQTLPLPRKMHLSSLKMGVVQRYTRSSCTIRVSGGPRARVPVISARCPQPTMPRGVWLVWHARLTAQQLSTSRPCCCASVVWCGVVWCGVVWCGVVWCGVVWCGVV